MKKKRINFFILFIIPIFAFFGMYINFDTMSAVVFVIVIAYLISKNRKKLDFQGMIKLLNIPLIYAVLWRTKFGLKFMDKVATKYREFIKLLGYCFIGFGFVGMILISANIVMLLVQLFISPSEAAKNVAPVLPLTNIPGLGYLSFWHFLITIFITVLVHEFAHGIVARAHNVPVRNSGVGVLGILLPIFPLAFVEPDEKILNKREDIVQYSIFAAGPMANILLYLVVMLFFTFAIIPIENNITHPIGFSFQALMENYSAQEVGLEPGMIINSINGNEVLTYQDFSDNYGPFAPGETLTLGTLNASYLITAKPSPDDPKKGFIGILGISNEQRINEKWAPIGGAFFWFKGLIRWLFLINLFVGLMNLLPLMITDGGRMLKIAFEKIFKDKKKADKLWTYIGMLFIFTLLFALVLRYTLLLFSLLG